MFFPLCAIPDYYERLYSYGLVTRATIDAAKKALDAPAEANVTDEHKLHAVMQVGFEYVGTMLNKYWLPKANITARIESFYEARMSGFYLIGVQMRMFFLNAEDTRVFAECALALETAEVTQAERKGKEV